MNQLTKALNKAIKQESIRKNEVSKSPKFIPSNLSAEEKENILQLMRQIEKEISIREEKLDRLGKKLGSWINV